MERQWAPLVAFAQHDEYDAPTAADANAAADAAAVALVSVALSWSFSLQDTGIVSLVVA